MADNREAALAGAAEGELTSVGTEGSAHIAPPDSRSKPAPDVPKAVAFLKERCDLLGVYPILSAKFVAAKGRFETKAFPPPVDWTKVSKWIADRQGKANIYYAVNRSSGNVDKKTSRADVTEMVALHVDCDARPMPQGEEPGAWVAKEVDRISKKLEAYDPPPSLIVHSGGGAQAFWNLEQPEAVDGDLTIAEDLKLYNLKLEQDLEGDSCHSLDHIMRLPGTINVPNEGKRKKGRVPALATVHLSKPERRYKLAQFEKATVAQPEDVGFSDSGKYERVAPNDPRLKGLDEKWVALGRIGDTAGDYLGQDGKPDRSRAALAFATACLRAKVAKQVLASVLMDPAWLIGECIRDKGGETQRQLKRLIERAAKFVDEDFSKPAVLGKNTLRKNTEKYRVRVSPHHIHSNGDHLDYKAGAYVVVEKDEVESGMFRFLDAAKRLTENDEGKQILVPFNPGPKDVTDHVAALRWTGHTAAVPPCWRDGRASPDPTDVISFPNGILDLRTGSFDAPDPMLFTTNAVGFDYDPKAPDPKNWKEFLKQIYGGEQDQIDALQEAFGYTISSDVSQEKAFMSIGPKRSGKDTQKNMLCALLSPNAVCGPTLNSMATNFGMSAFVHKQVAIVGDMRLGHKADQDLLAENVLKLTGRGLFTFDRKFKEHWTGRLPCKLWLISNERPRIKDVRGALASRFITFNTRTSFYGKEDSNLFRDKLAPEAPGVLLWALEGLRRVRERGSLAEPACSVEARQTLAREGSPVLAFVEERVSLVPDAEMTKDELHAAYKEWSEKSGMHAKDKAVFMRDLEAVVGTKVKPVKLTRDGERVWGVRGVKLLGPGPRVVRPERQPDIPF
ncbi:MAG: hypothetical protein K2Y71_29215 [Xanthobacteraceae bacterium]|nr:hypothetical protein [Xanthobacteraceae bacterium]